MANVFQNRINSLEELEELRPQLGFPSSLVSNKVIYKLDPYSRAFIEKSPFIMIATSDKDGLCDVSPRGDEPGFVYIVDDQHLFIPDRPGNKRMDSIRNIFSNPQIGIIFLIPGLEETFRMNGRACISRDPELLQATAAKGKLPLLGIGVEIEECYMHCAKAFKRSGLWSPDSWLPKEQLPSAAKIIAAHVGQKMSVTEREVRESLDNSYRNRLY
ncbi:pyridoxamine 5'-phosphate oxidase family protein [Paenibacillus nanensis]|uniref:Pyridoxamine 5'-phosphate oxidase family protein n=1 Tax=Paenibacillus nanensis TaxID=393251 RepID=A0A3A1V1Q6_9BACL|nr:pyridoxamine 5'-phosphate oxidase family protein [Paenibacillus nanensis]RIX53751.1 pyridoxamine 5'-phosphate oxidase family protein [Paenibacillus nanensis]